MNTPTPLEALVCGILRNPSITLDMLIGMVDWEKAGLDPEVLVTWWKEVLAKEKNAARAAKAAATRQAKKLQEQEAKKAALAKLTPDELKALQHLGLK